MKVRDGGALSAVAVTSSSPTRRSTLRTLSLTHILMCTGHEVPRARVSGDRLRVGASGAPYRARSQMERLT